MPRAKRISHPLVEDKPKRPWLWIALLAMVAAVGYGIYRYDPVWARVGHYTIRKSDAVLRGAIIEQYFPKQGSPDKGLEQLKRVYRYAVILENHHHPITEATLKSEGERIQKSTLNAEALGKIQALFVHDPAAYARVYLLPVYAERTIYYDFFLHDPEIQGPSRRVAEQFRDRAVARPKQFAAMAKEMGKSTTPLSVSLTEGLRFETPSPAKDHPAIPEQTKPPERIVAKMQEQQSSQQSQEGRQWRDELLKGLKPGAVVSKVIEQSENWMVVQYLGRAKGVPEKYNLLAVVFPKADYASWLAAEEGKIGRK